MIYRMRLRRKDVISTSINPLQIIAIACNYLYYITHPPLLKTPTPFPYSLSPIPRLKPVTPTPSSTPLYPPHFLYSPPFLTISHYYSSLLSLSSRNSELIMKKVNASKCRMKKDIYGPSPSKRPSLEKVFPPHNSAFLLRLSYAN